MLHRGSFVVVALVLGVGAGCRGSGEITGATPPSQQPATGVPMEIPAPVAAALAGLQPDPLAKAELPPPEITLRSPCRSKVFHVGSWSDRLIRVDWFMNICGDSFLRITDVFGERWISALGNRPPW